MSMVVGRRGVDTGALGALVAVGIAGRGGGAFQDPAHPGVGDGRGGAGMLEQGAEVMCMSDSLPTLFRQANGYRRQRTFTPTGVIAEETSDDPQLTQTIRAHAREVTGFVRDGMPAMMQGMMGGPDGMMGPGGMMGPPDQAHRIGSTTPAHRSLARAASLWPIAFGCHSIARWTAASKAGR